MANPGEENSGPGSLGSDSFREKLRRFLEPFYRHIDQPVWIVDHRLDLLCCNAPAQLLTKNHLDVSWSDWFDPIQFNSFRDGMEETFRAQQEPNDNTLEFAIAKSGETSPCFNLNFTILPAILQGDDRQPGIGVIVASPIRPSVASFPTSTSPSRKDYQSLVENLPLNVFHKDLEGRITFVNQRYARELEIDAKELIGKTDNDLFPDELAEKYRRDDQWVLQTGHSFRDIEIHPKGEGTIYVELIKAPITDQSGKMVGIQGCSGMSPTGEKRNRRYARPRKLPRRRVRPRANSWRMSVMKSGLR